MSKGLLTSFHRISGALFATALLLPGVAGAATINIIPSLTFQTLRVEATSPFTFPDSAPNLVTNGSFEQNFSGRFVGDGWQTYANLPGWTGGSNGIELRRDVAGTAFEGPDRYFVELDTNTNSSMQQTVSTVAGKLYALSFEYSPRPGVAGFLGTGLTNSISVYWNNAYLGTVFASGAGLTDNEWHTIIAWNLPGTGTTGTLRFVADGLPDSFGGSIDNVQLAEVPLPPIVWMLGASMLAWFGYTRRGCA